MPSPAVAGPARYPWNKWEKLEVKHRNIVSKYRSLLNNIENKAKKDVHNIAGASNSTIKKLRNIKISEKKLKTMLSS